VSGLASRFEACWRGLGCTNDPAPTYEALVAAWREPHRVYHSPDHLRTCLELFDEVRDRAERPADVEAALWFHDAVYDTHPLDNEARSARWAREALAAGGADPSTGARVADLVRETRHDAPANGGDAALVVDVDLAVLGFPAEEFDAYARGVRDEYRWVDEPEWRLARRRVLAGFLARDPLYRTPELRVRFETRARDNLARATAALRQ